MTPERCGSSKSRPLRISFSLFLGGGGFFLSAIETLARWTIRFQLSSNPGIQACPGGEGSRQARHGG